MTGTTRRGRGPPRLPTVPTSGHWSLRRAPWPPSRWAQWLPSRSTRRAIREVLIADESGMSPHDWPDAMALFSPIPDSVTATAVLDRLLHDSHVVKIHGESHSLSEKRPTGLFASRSRRGVTQPRREPGGQDVMSCFDPRTKSVSHAAGTS